MAEQAFSAIRLARILGKLGSDHDGEILAAARAAHRMVTDAGRSWSEVLAVQPTAAFEPEPDEPIRFGARLIHPPYGESWLGSALHLIREADKPGAKLKPDDREWLTRRLWMWRTRKLHAYEAAILADMARTVAPSAA